MAWVVRCCFSAAKGRTPGSGHHKKARKSLTWMDPMEYKDSGKPTPNPG